MAFPFITPDNIFKRWQESKTYTDQLTQPFPEYQRIARNEPYPGADPNYPNVTDGTTASIIQKTPKRVVQQLPTGKVITDDEGWLGIVADFIYVKKIIPYANEDYGLFEKSHLMIENGLTNGSAVSYAPFLNHDGYFCPDMTVPYWGDLFLQKGKKSGKSNNFNFIRSWWQQSDIDALIKSEKEQKAKSKDYESTWDIGVLEEIKEHQDSKDQQSLTPEEQARGVDVTAIEMVTAFQKGVGAKFYTFNPATESIARTKVNKDPRGKMPLDWFYGDIDGTNPLGRGIVELLGGLQNLIDSDMQAYQYNRALALQPPVVKYGNVGNFKFEPNAVLDARGDPNAKIVPLVIDTSALVNYPALYGLQKSQLLNLVTSPDTSISSDVGNPGFSKTPAGVNAQQANISVDDNAIRKQFEIWFQSWSETAINLYFAERTGVEEIQLDKETAMKLRELPGFDQSLLSEDNKIMMNYDTDTPILKFRVDPSTTSVKDTIAQVQDATNLLDLVMKYPMLNSNYGGPIEVDVLARRIVVNSGIDDPEQVAPEPTAAQKQSKEEQKNTVSPFSPMFDKPSIRMNYPDLPVAAQVQILANAGVQVTPEDIMQGPVADPNIRGVMNPVSDPNELTPGGQPGQPAGAGTNPIDIGDIYKTTTDPVIKAQIEAMAGLTPDVNHVANQIDTNTAQHVGSQAEGLNKMATAINPPQPILPAPARPTPKPKVSAQQTPQPQNTNVAQSPQEQLQPGLPPEDQQLVDQMKQLGVSDAVISQVIDMLNKGASAQDVIQMLQPQGAQ